MSKQWKLTLFGLFASMALLSGPSFAQSQNDVALNAPQEFEPDDPDFDQRQLAAPTNIAAHPFMMVNGVEVYYFFDSAGRARYYYFNNQGSRVFYPLGWRPSYSLEGSRVFFTPTPFLLFDGLRSAL